MLLALCHDCWTWMEPKHERCVECGHRQNLQEPDPDAAELRLLFGESLLVLSEVSLNRARLPSRGVLSAYEQGILFLPDLRELPTGGIVGVEGTRSGLFGGPRTGFWNLFSRRTSASPAGLIPVVRPRVPVSAAVDRFMDSPGALFLRRESVVRILQRGSILRIERKPGRTVTCRLESPVSTVRDSLRKLQANTFWMQSALALGG